MTDYMPGDVLFYTFAKGNIFEEAIASFTSSKFVHVAIAISAIQKIEALGNGVIISPVDNRVPYASWSYTGNTPGYSRVSLHNALVWLINQKGNAYSWGDIANVVLEREGIKVAIATNNLLFCSGLATEFLMKAGSVPGLQDVINPHDVTPAMLAKILNVEPTSITGNRLPAIESSIST